MKYYRLKEHATGWSLKAGKIYSGYHKSVSGKSVEFYAEAYPMDWEEVSLDKWMCDATEKYITYMKEWRNDISGYTKSYFSTGDALLSKQCADKTFYYAGSNVKSVKALPDYQDYTVLTDEEWYELIYLPWKTKQEVPAESTFKGQLEDFPAEVVEKMLERQVAQGNPRDVTVFEKQKTANKSEKGFDWELSPEYKTDDLFWNEVILRKNFDKFFEKYPKQTKSNQVLPLNSNQNDNQIIGSPILLRVPKAQYRTETISRTGVRASTQKITIASGQVEHRARAAKA